MELLGACMRKKTITVRETTYMKLLMLKESLGFLTWDELLNSLVKCVERKVKS
jgi:predicted CopG family antitoxin